MIRVDIDSRAVSHYLSQLASRAANPPLKKMQIVAHRSVLRNFQDQGRPKHWPQLKESTRAGRDAKSKKTAAGRRSLQRTGGRYAILQDKGGLKQSIQAAALGKTNFIVYTKKEYAPHHQFGAPKANIPARPFMMWQDEDVKLIKSMLLNHVINGRVM